MADLTIKQNDTWPPLEATLSDQDGPVNLTTASTILLLLKPALTPLTIFQGVCEVVSAVDGKIRYVWDEPDTAIADTYAGEFEVTWTDSTITTFPNAGYFSLEIQPDIGP